jgi:hypothetical protein
MGFIQSRRSPDDRSNGPDSAGASTANPLDSFCALPPPSLDRHLGQDRHRDLLRRDRAEIETGRRLDAVEGGGRNAASPSQTGRYSAGYFELKQAMGGGKTYSMLALGYLAANPLPAAAENEVIFGFVREAIQLSATRFVTRSASPTSMTHSVVISSSTTCCRHA